MSQIGFKTAHMLKNNAQLSDDLLSLAQEVVSAKNPNRFDQQYST